MRLHLFIKSAAFLCAISLLVFALTPSLGFRDLARFLAASCAIGVFFTFAYPEVRGVHKGDRVSVMRPGANSLTARVGKALHNARKNMPLRVRFEGGDEAFGTLEDHGGIITWPKVMVNYEERIA